MKRLLTLLVALGAITAVDSRGQVVTGFKQAKAGEVIQLAEGLTVRVSKPTTAQFTGVKLKGQPLVLTVQFDAGKQGVTLSYKATPDPKSSELYLTSAEQSIAPSAVLEDFPSWGSDNDKQVEVFGPKETGGRVVVTFAQQGSVSLLFDVSAEQAKAPQKFSMMFRTAKPKDEQHSFVVSL